MRIIISWALLVLLIIGTFTLTSSVVVVRAQAETIYINSDARSLFSTPISSTGNITYTFTGNITGRPHERSVGTSSSYTFTDIQANHTLAVNSAPSGYYTITASAGVGGSIDPSGDTWTRAGVDAGFMFYPNPFYAISDVIVDGVSVGARIDYVFVNPQANHNITVTFVHQSLYPIYINADGSIDPPTAPISTSDNITYTLTSCTVNRSIVVERNNIVLDGARYTLQGDGGRVRFGALETGIDLSGRTNVTIQNLQITAFNQGIKLYQLYNDTIVGNNITANDVGIYSVRVGVSPSYQSDLIYHNNFINNTLQADQYSLIQNSLWDNGYPSGGNYWSDDNGTDLHSGPYQNESGSDGIDDSEYSYGLGVPLYQWYVVVEDHYPLTTPFGSNLPLAYPAAHFTYTPLQPIVNQTVVFNASTTICTNGTIIRYNWDFGDGKSGVGQTVSHVYSAIGNCTVTLTVISNTRIPDTENQIIYVQQPPMPLWEFWTLIVGGAATIVLVSIAVYLFVKRIRHMKRMDAREHLDKYLATKV